jgi:hypothetical protein
MYYSVRSSDADPYVFGLPRSGSGSFYPLAKIVRKFFIPTVLMLHVDFLKNCVNVASKSNKQKNFFLN